MQATALPSSVRDFNDRAALPAALVAVNAVGNHARGVFPVEEVNRRQGYWGESEYLTALIALAQMHATWWGEAYGPSVESWVLHETSYDIEDARSALLEIEAAPWGGRYLAREQIHGWLVALDNPGCMLGILMDLPRTLIHGDSGAGDVAERGYGWGEVAIGPAPYDVACFYSSSRWRFGKLPAGRIEMRNWYLEHLNERLGMARLDRYTFDMAFDAALAWRFAALWLPSIVEHHVTLLARATHLRATVIEPAWASLRRCC